MVDAKPIIDSYRCGKCGRLFPNEEEANECCEKKVIDWEYVDEFELKQVHLDLLKETVVSWDNCEFGAPCIDCKRPYGNSNVEEDIAEIIKLTKKGNWDYEDECWNEKATDFMVDLHKQTQIALEIILQCSSFRLGVYKRSERYKPWKFVGEKK